MHITLSKTELYCSIVLLFSATRSLIRNNNKVNKESYLYPALDFYIQ